MYDTKAENVKNKMMMNFAEGIPDGDVGAIKAGFMEPCKMVCFIPPVLSGSVNRHYNDRYLWCMGPQPLPKRDSILVVYILSSFQTTPMN